MDGNIIKETLNLWQKSLNYSINTTSNIFLGNLELANAGAKFISGLIEETKRDLIEPLNTASKNFMRVESEKALQRTPIENASVYSKLNHANLTKFMQIGQNANSQNFNYLNRLVFGHEYSKGEPANGGALHALVNTISGNGGEYYHEWAKRQRETIETATTGLERKLIEVEPEFGLNFKEGYKEELNTDLHSLLQVLPVNGTKPPKKNNKPILIIPPDPLGPDVALLWPEKRSLAHACVAEGIPTYIFKPNISKMHNINLENMTEDINKFSEHIHRKHKNLVTHYGTCHGGNKVLIANLARDIANHVNVIILDATPTDGTQSLGMQDLLSLYPKEMLDIDYSSTKNNRKKVIEGSFMSWIYRLKESSSPFQTLIEKIYMCDRGPGNEPNIPKSAVIVQRYLRNKVPLSPNVTEASRHIYDSGIDENGNYSFKVNGNVLNIKELQNRGIHIRIQTNSQDNLIEPAAQQAIVKHLKDYSNLSIVINRKGGHLSNFFSVFKKDHPDYPGGYITSIDKEKYPGTILLHKQIAEETKGHECRYCK